MLVVIHRSNNNASDLVFLSTTSLSRTCAAALRCCCLTLMHQIAKIADISWGNHRRKRDTSILGSGVATNWPYVRGNERVRWVYHSKVSKLGFVSFGRGSDGLAVVVQLWRAKAFLLLLLLQQSALECVALPINCVHRVLRVRFQM